MEALTRRNLFVTAGVAAAGATAATIARTPAWADPPASFDGYVNDEGGEVVNIKNPAYGPNQGAKGDTVVAPSGASIVAGSNNLTVAAPYQFVSGDVGKVVTIQGAGLNGVVLSTTITSITSPTVVKLADVAMHAVTNGAFSYGTDDTQAIVDAIEAAGWLHTLYAPAGIYTIRGASNTGDTGGGNQLHLPSRGGLVGQGGKYVPSDSTSRPNTVFFCADASAGLLFSGHARFEGFMVDGNNIATLPIRSNQVAGGNGTQYAMFIDVWVTRSAADGWTIYASQNCAFYDCGSTDNAQDGVYFDMGTGGHDFFNFYERGSLRYGIRGDNKVPGGGFVYLPGDIQFYGGCLDTHPTRQGVSKVNMGPALEWGFFDMDIVGSNLSGPTMQVSQTLSENHRISRCRIWATPKGMTRGNACIQISGTSEQNGVQHQMLKTDGCAFMAGDNSVYVAAASGYDQYSARGWVLDATAFGPVGATSLPDADVMLQGRTGKWRQATLLSPWTGTVRYRITSEGWLQLEGSATSLTGLAGKIFVLPVGYRLKIGNPRTVLVAVCNTSGSQVGVGQISIQNGAATNVNAGAVSYVQVAGSGPFTGGTVVHLDGVCVPARPTDGQMW
jgi:hypothetical protein